MRGSFVIENCVLAPTYSPPKRSTIGDEKLNFRVRNENGCTLLANAPTHNIQFSIHHLKKDGRGGWIRTTVLRKLRAPIEAATFSRRSRPLSYAHETFIAYSILGNFKLSLKKLSATYNIPYGNTSD